VNNIPKGETVKCYLSPIRALPVVKAKLANPSVAIAGRHLRFPVALESGQYLEFESPSRCTLHDERGATLGSITPGGDVPQLAAGENRIELSCDAVGGAGPRAKVTLIAQGTPLRGGPSKTTDWSLLRTECDDPRLIRALDGKQNAWEVICRGEVPAGAAGKPGRRAAPPGAAGKPGRGGRPHLEVEVLVERAGQVGAAYDAPGALTVESFDDLARFADTPDNRFARYAYDSEDVGVPAKPGVTHRIERATDVVKVGGASLRYTATSTRGDDAGWCAKGERFATPLDLSGYTALGFWIHGDAAGEVLKLQLRDTAGAWQDMVTPVDFTGWKYVEFVLGEGAKIDLSKVEYAILYYNNLPGGKTVACLVDDIRALREPAALRKPSLAVGSRKVVFPVSLAAGERLVYQGTGDCRLYARDGTLKATRRPTGGPLTLAPGSNRVVFGLAGTGGGDFQVRVMATKVYL